MTEQEWRQKFAREIKRRTVPFHITQRELALRAGISEVTLSRYLKCTRSPGGVELIKIARALNCSVDELINFGEFVE